MSTWLVIYFIIGLFLGSFEAYAAIYRGASNVIILYCFFVNLFLWFVIQPIGFIIGWRKQTKLIRERERLVREMRGRKR